MGSKPEAMRVWLFGGFRVSVGSRTIDEDAWRLRKAASLLKLLALAPGHRLHRERAMDLLWPELGLRAASNNLRQTLHVARRTLRPDPESASRLLSLSGEQLVLCPDGGLWVDADAFEDAVATARRSGDPAAYRAAIELYVGELLPEDRYEEWAEERREELRATYLSLLGELAALYEERGEFGPAVETLRRAVTEEPTNEEAHAGLMRLYAVSDRRREALAQYERLREVLSGQLGTEPNAATQRLREEIAAGGFPTPRTPPTSSLQDDRSAADKHNLPAPRTSFVGREREMLEVKRELAMTRLLTLTGVGGSGKTRLALEVARDLISAYPDGVWLVELAPLSEPELVAQEVARALEVPEQPDRTLTDALVESLGSQEILLILDNCEHLVDAAAGLVDVLLDACPRLRILATSREALDVAGEVRWPVPALSVPDPRRPLSVGELEGYESARLFAERARRRNPAFILRPENARAVAEICWRLEGIPLAIELAAVWVGVLNVEHVAAKLDDSVKLLTGGSRAATPRQRTLRGALDWSHDLLSETERELFRRMAVLAGGWTLEAAEAVGAGGGVKEEDVLGLLSRLVDKSLVVAEATGNDEARYRMLEPIRQYGLERLEESGEAEEVRRRHAEFFLALAEEAEPTLMGPQQGVWLKQLETEHDNLRAALSWSLEHGEAQLSLRLSGGLWRFWVRRGHLREGRRWLEAALTKHSAAVPATRVKALGGLGLIVERGGDERKAKALFVETLKLYGELGDEAGTAISLHNLGWVAILQDELESAGERFEESLAHYRRLDDDFGAARALYGLGYAATAAADYECARAHLEEALELFHGVGDYAYVAKCLGSLGRLAMLLGELEWAEGLFEEGLARFREAGTPPEAEHLIDLGLVALGQGNLGRARRLVGEGLVIARQEGSWSRLAMGIEAMAMVASANGETRRGAFLWGAAKAMRGTIGFRHYPDEHAMYRAYVEAARESLGETAWEAVFAEGRAMAPDEAVTYALSKEEPPSPAHEQAPPDEPSVALTHREREVTALVARGLSNRQIASELHLSERTVENHIAKILRKLGLASRTQVAAWATEQRLLAPDPD